jgi:hypothetical protein
MAEILKWDACTMDPRLWMRAIECHPASTAGLATAAAILVSAAIAIVLWRRDKARRDEERVDRSFHVVASIFGHLWGLDTELASLRRRATEFGTSIPRDWPKWADRMGLPIPVALIEAVPRMDGGVENIVGRFRDLTMLVVAYNDFIERVTRLDRSGLDDRWPEVVGQIERYYLLIETSLHGAMDVVKSKEPRSQPH